MVKIGIAAVLAVVIQASFSFDHGTAQSTGSQPFDITDTLILTYSTPAQRDVILQQILVIWRNALNQYQTSKVTVKFSSETGASSDSAAVTSQTAPTAGKRMQVTYHITGQSVLPVDVSQTTSTFRKTLQDAHVAGAELMSTDATGGSQTSEESEQSDDSTKSATDGSSQGFSTTDTVTLTYTSTAQRDQFLQQILSMWRNALNTYQATNVVITFVSERSSSTQSSSSTTTVSKIVTYRITAQTTKTVETEVVKSTVHKTITDAHLIGMQLAPASEMQSLDMPDSDSANKDSTDDSGSDDSSATQQFSTTDTVELTYTTVTQRESFLRQIQTFWKQALSLYATAINVEVTFVTETTSKTTSTSKIVTYRVTAQTNQTVTTSTVKGTVHDTIQSAGVSGIRTTTSIGTNAQQTNDQGTGADSDTSSDNTDQSSDDQGNTSTDTSAGTGDRTSRTETGQSNGSPAKQFTTTDSASLTYTTAKQRDALGNTSTDTSAGTGDRTSRTETGQSNGSPAKQFTTTDSASLTYTTAKQRDALLQQILTVWKKSLASSKASDFTIVFVSERPIQTTGTKVVTYRISSMTVQTVNTQTVKSSVRQAMQASPIPGVQVPSPADSTAPTADAQDTSSIDTNTDTSNDQPQPVVSSAKDTTTGTDDSSQPTDVADSSASASAGNGGQTITDTLPLAYGSPTERDNSMEWIRRLWAYVLGVRVGSAQVKVTNDVLLSSGYLPSKTQGHNVTYTVTVTGSDIPNFDAQALLTRFQQLLPASTTSYLVTFPSGVIPTTMNITVIDQIRGPQKSVDQQGLQSFMIYDTISFSYKTMQERNKILEAIRRAWEQALARGAVSTDLIVRNDIPNPDDTHTITYLITILSPNNDWDTKQLETTFRQVLSTANIPSLVMPDSDTIGGVTAPADDGVRSFVFYDDITITYTTTSQLNSAVEAIRKTWEKVLGSQAGNVQVSLYMDTDVDHQTSFSYTIMFTSQNATEWDFEDLQAQFTKLIPTIKGGGFTVTGPQARSSDDDETFRARSIDVHRGDSKHAPQTKSHTEGHEDWHRRPTLSATTTTIKTTSVYSYFLSDAVTLDFTRETDRDAALEAIRQTWARLLGTRASSVQVSMNSDFKLTKSTRHNINFHIMIVSNNAHFEAELEEIRAQFWSTLSTSTNIFLQKAQRLIVLPFIKGNLDQMAAADTPQETTMDDQKTTTSRTLPALTMAIRGAASATSDQSSDSDDDSEDSGADVTTLAPEVTDGSTPSDTDSSDDQTTAPASDTDSSDDQTTTPDSSSGSETTAADASSADSSDSDSDSKSAVRKPRGTTKATTKKATSKKPGHKTGPTTKARKSVDTDDSDDTSDTAAEDSDSGVVTSDDSTDTTSDDDTSNQSETDDKSKTMATGSKRRDDDDRPNRKTDIEIRGRLTLSYRNKRDRDDAFAQIKRLWIRSNALDDVDDVVIKFTREFFPGQQFAQIGRDISAHDYEYVITGTTRSKRFSEHRAKRQLLDLLDDRRLPFLVSSRTMATSEETSSSETNDKSKTIATGTKGRDDDRPNRKTDIEIRGRLTLRYQNKRERDDAFAQIKRLWSRSNVLGDVDDVAIDFTKEFFPNGQFAQVGRDISVHDFEYVITGKTRSKGFNENRVKRQLLDALVDRRLPFLVSARSMSGTEQVDDESPSTSKIANDSPSRNLRPTGGDSLFANQVNAYVIHDQFRYTADSDDDRAAYLDKLELIWRQIFGNDTESLKTFIDDDTALSGKNFKTHDIKYVVVIVSHQRTLDLQAARAQFAEQKPAPTITLVAPEPLSTEPFSNAVVLLQSIPFISTTDMDEKKFISGIEEQWQLALGHGVQLVRAWSYHQETTDSTITSAATSKTTTASELSYAVLIVSKMEVLDASMLKLTLEQYLLTKMITGSTCMKACVAA